MGHTARRGAAERRQRRPRAAGGGVGVAVLAGAGAVPIRPAPVADPVWWRSVRPVARVAIWALPGYAAVQVWWSVTGSPDPAVEPGAWAHHVGSADYLRVQLLAGLGGALLGLVATVTLVALLLGLRGRRIAIAALLTALAAAVVLLPRFGLTIVAARTVAGRVRDGSDPAVRLYLDIQAAATPVLVSGLVLASAAWVLLGLAVFRSRVFGRGDGFLLLVAGPLIGAGGLVAPILASLGALLLLAAGLGIGWTASRLTRAAPVPGERVPGERVPGERVPAQAPEQEAG